MGQELGNKSLASPPASLAALQKLEARGSDDAIHKGEHRDMEQHARWRIGLEKPSNLLMEVPLGDSGAGTQFQP